MKTIDIPVKIQKRAFTIPILLSLVFMALAPSGLAASQPASGSGVPTLGIVQQWSLTAPDPNSLDEYGYAVALDGNTAVIGARNADPNPGNGPIEDAGAAYVYTYNGKTWILQDELIAKDASSGDIWSGGNGNIRVTGVLEDKMKRTARCEMSAPPISSPAAAATGCNRSS
jgi:hypothetical protein